VATLEHLIASLEQMAADAPTELPKRDLSKIKFEAEAITPTPEIDLPDWWNDGLDANGSDAEVIYLPVKKPAFIYLPLLLQNAWLPNSGTPEKYIRSFRGLSFVSTTGVYPNGEPIGLPSGLQARRLLIALISQSVIKQSRKIDVSSIRALMRWTNMRHTARQQKRLQKTLLQLATVNVSIWFAARGSKKAQIYNGNMFDSLFVDLIPEEQTRFSFIPEEITFSEGFYNAVVQRRSMPFIADQVMRARSPLVHDVLLWCLHRQAVITKPLFLGYGLLYHQFKTPGQSLAKFTYEFKKAIDSLQAER
jgi:hypothetical protein